jgi:SAM-dependent methyltransferase
MILGLGAGLLASVALMRLCRKPWGWPGQGIARLMNASHGDLTAWGLGQLSFGRDAEILDVGCGGGKTLQRLLDLAPEGRVHGIDYAAASVAVATKVNAEAIAAGRMEVRRGSVSQLPYPSATFDVATAVETHYYWPDLAGDLREVRRVLRPGGRMLILAESYRAEGRGGADAFVMGLLGGRVLTAAKHRDLLTAAGFVGVEVREEGRRGWLCVLGTNPS